MPQAERGSERTACALSSHARAQASPLGLICLFPFVLVLVLVVVLGRRTSNFAPAFGASRRFAFHPRLTFFGTPGQFLKCPNIESQGLMAPLVGRSSQSVFLFLIVDPGSRRSDKPSQSKSK